MWGLNPWLLWEKLWVSRSLPAVTAPGVGFPARLFPCVSYLGQCGPPFARRLVVLSVLLLFSGVVPNVA